MSGQVGIRSFRQWIYAAARPDIEDGWTIEKIIKRAEELFLQESMCQRGQIMHRLLVADSVRNNGNHGNNQPKPREPIQCGFPTPEIDRACSS